MAKHCWVVRHASHDGLASVFSKRKVVDSTQFGPAPGICVLPHWNNLFGAAEMAVRSFRGCPETNYGHLNSWYFCEDLYAQMLVDFG
jgi:hypothetical protein